MLCKKGFLQVLGVLALLGTLDNSPVFGANWKVLPGHVPRELSRLQTTGRLAATNQLRLAIGVPLRDAAGLENFLAQVYDPASPNYRRYLTPEEFTARFGPTEQDYDAVKQFARTNGLTIAGTHDNRLLLDVAGPAAAVEKALHVTLRTYPHPTEARQFFAPDTEPVVEAGLPVADIQGLSDFSKPHPRLKRANATNSPKTGSGSGGAYLGNDFRNAYAAGTTLTGAGQMVGLLQFDGFYASDIAAYARAAGGGRTNIVIQKVLLDGYNGVPTANGGSDEVSLDIEMAMAMAPGLSRIVVFEGGPNGLQNDVLNAMAANSAVKNLSCSWGWDGGPSSTTDNIFKQMAAQGQSFFNASGDSGAFTVGATSMNGVDNTSTANAPSSSPYITQVGGTTLNMNDAGASFASETVWNWGGGSASSGGVSSYYSIPAWQAGMSMTSNLGSTTQRNIPDVAMTADNVYVISGGSGTGSGGWGGTSCAAPLWAGFMALVNQQAASTGNPPAGLINPAVYAIGQGQNSSYSYRACFHDTTTGNNYWSSSSAKYPAVSGYDLCTGWGTPNGANLIYALAGSGAGVSPQASLGISPQAGFAASGPIGGPFSPSSGVFQLTNASASNLIWSLAGFPAWLKANSTNGTLASNSMTALTVSVTTAANSLKAGNYSSFLAFSNQTTHVVQSIPVALQVFQPMFLTPTNGFTAVGPVGGRFTPSSQVLIVSNLSSGPLKWSLIKTSAWLTVSATNGSIAAGGQASVTVSLSSSANTLRAAVYNSTIRFTNTAGLFAVIPFRLSIGQPLVQNGGFETGNFSGWTQSGNTTYTSVTSANSAFVHSGARGARLGPSGTPGYLSQNLTTAAGQTYLLSLWLRNAAGSTPNWFQVQWNGATVFEQADLATTAWTNLQFLVTAASGSSTLQLGFQHDPYYFGLDDVSLKAVTNSAAIKSMVRAANSFQLVWNTAPGMVYQVQYKTNLLQADWIDLGAATSAQTNALKMTDTNAFLFSPQRYYRLLMLP